MPKLEQYIGEKAELLTIFVNNSEFGGVVEATSYYLFLSEARFANTGNTSMILALRFEDGTIFPIYEKGNIESITLEKDKKKQKRN